MSAKFAEIVFCAYVLSQAIVDVTSGIRTHVFVWNVWKFRLLGLLAKKEAYWSTFVFIAVIYTFGH